MIISFQGCSIVNPAIVENMIIQTKSHCTDAHSSNRYICVSYINVGSDILCVHACKREVHITHNELWMSGSGVT